MTSPAPAGTRALLEQLAEGDPEGSMSLSELLDRFSERAFGLFLLLVLLPCFIPLPIGQGTVCGSFTMLIGVQLLLRKQHPWLPGVLARHRIQRRTLVNFRDRMGRWLLRIERLSKPRGTILLEHPLAHAFTGLLLIALGLLLALPLPLTNYPFGLLLLAYAFALIERDGWLLLLAWILGLGEIVIIAGFSSQITHWLVQWWH